MRIKTFESFNSRISSLEELNPDDIITYQGSKNRVIKVDKYIAILKSLETGREFTINQAQVSQNSVFLVN